MDILSARDLISESKINLENEIEVLQSYPILKKVVEDLNLTTSFYGLGDIMTDQLAVLPFKYFQKIEGANISNEMIYEVKFIDDLCEIYDKENDKVYSYNFEKSDKNFKELPFYFKISDKDFLKIKKFKSFRIRFVPIQHVINSLKEDLNISVVGKKSEIIAISLETKNTQISSNILNSLIDNFNNDGIHDRRLVHKNTIDFVNERFVDIISELDSIELHKEKFKLNNKLVDISANSSLSLQLSSESMSEIFLTENQIALADLLLKKVNAKSFVMLPSNIGIDNSSINEFITTYNEYIIKFQNLQSIAGENNPALILLKNNIINTKSSISESIKTYLDQLNETKTNLEQQNNSFNTDVKKIPEKEKILRSIERSQLIKEQLYLFLLKKREEAEINYAITEPSIKVVESALTSSKPLYPKTTNVFLTSIFLGLLFPFLSIIILRYLDNKVRNRDDLKILDNSTAIVGEIPFAKDNETSNFNPNSRSILAESYRMLMSNVKYLLNESQKCHLIISTSTIKGEGKTFTAVNYSLSLSSVGKKVLLIGADLRNPQLHNFLKIDKNNPGLSNYLVDSSMEWKKYLIKGFDKHESHDTLISGVIPPNPVQLLSNGKFLKLIEEAKKVYDYIVVDSPPLLLVTDTFIIGSELKPDAILYLLRSGYSNKNLLKFINDSIKQSKLTNIGVVLNSIGEIDSSSYGYKYGYSYNYSYGYNYNYGYGYGYGSENEDG